MVELILKKRIMGLYLAVNKKVEGLENVTLRLKIWF